MAPAWIIQGIMASGGHAPAMRQAALAIVGRVCAGGSRAVAISPGCLFFPVVVAIMVVAADDCAPDAAASTDGQAHASARIRLKGTSHLDVHAAREGGALVLSGIVLDDAARPMPGLRVDIDIAFASASAPGAGPRAALSPLTAQSCGAADATPNINRADTIALTTDAAARFCIRLALATNRYVAHIEAHGSELVEGATLDVPIDLSLPPVTLRFDPERAAISLDDDTTSVDVVASTEEDGMTAPATGLVLSLSNEVQTHLAEAMTDGLGRARFAFDSARLGAPGKGDLRVTFSGSRVAGASSHSMPIERRTFVDLVAPAATGGRLSTAWPEDGVALRVDAKARCISRGCAERPGGTIEARAGADTVVGAAPVDGDRGEAHLFLVFAAPTADAIGNAPPAEVPLSVRYIPDAPWFQPAAAIVLMQPVAGPSPCKKAPLLLAAAVVIAWLGIARSPVRWGQRPRRPARPRAPDLGGERVELLHTAAPSHGWTGRVVDANDGVALPRSRVAIERRGFERVDVVCETTSGASGAFALPPFDARPGDDLVAEGPLHTELRHPLPPPGELVIALVLRKRALVDRMVRWARRQGPPYVVAPDPTPQDVVRAAGSNAAVARWANAVERAAYGADLVDAGAEGAVDELAPEDDRLGPR